MAKKKEIPQNWDILKVNKYLGRRKKRRSSTAVGQEIMFGY